MNKFYLGAVLAIGLASSANAAVTDRMMVPIHQFMDGFERGDMKLAGSAHDASGVTIVDEVPPHLWTGRTAFAAWGADLAKDDKAAGISGEKVVLGAPTRREVTGDHGYVVAPAVFTYMQKGVAMREPAHMTFAMRRGPAGWKIAAWTWVGGKAAPAGK